MKDRRERVTIFDETMKLCRANPKLADAVRNSIRDQRIFWQEEETAYDAGSSQEPLQLYLSHKRSFEAARSYALEGTHKVCVLNFASSVTPGGGVTMGMSAQEESMCRISTLYPAISDRDTAGGFYEKHRQMITDRTMGRENRDDCIYTPGVIVMREDTLECAILPEQDWYMTDVITCAAPDLRWAGIGYTFQPTPDLLQQYFERRFRKILSVAAQAQVDVLILGAFGCGAFRNPPEIVVNAFNQIISEFEGSSIRQIEFAVYTGNLANGNYQAFKQISGIVETDELKQAGVGKETNPAVTKQADAEKEARTARTPQADAEKDGKTAEAAASSEVETAPSDAKNFPVPEINLEAVNKTLAFIHERGFGLTEEELSNPKLSEKLDYYGSRLFDGGTYGQCFYKLLCYLMRYIKPVLDAGQYQHSAAALLVTTGNFFCGPYRGDRSIEEFYQMMLQGITHMESISWHILLDNEVDERVFREICDSYGRTGSIETASMLKVLKALEWNEDRIAGIEEDIWQNRLDW